MSAEYLDPIKDALYCEAPASRVRRSVQTALYEMIRTVSLWMAPILCFTAQDVADELARATGEPFDVHGAVRVVDPGEKLGNPNRRWTDEIRPRREAILRPLEAFRAAGHKSLEARVRVTPAAAERPHWQWSLAHLTELCVVSRVELDAADAPRARHAHRRRRGARADLPALLAAHRRVRRPGRARPRTSACAAPRVVRASQGRNQRETPP